MNRIKLKKSSIMDYEVYIFDLDGTLYYQKPFRIRMLWTLVKHVILHPKSIRDLFVIKTYREVREQWEQREKEHDFREGMSLDERQYAYVAAKTGVSCDCVRQAVEFFMHKLPLKLLPAFRDEILEELIQKLKKEKKKVVIYSDYPVEEKLTCLDIYADACYTSGDACIGCMKPDPKGIHVILNALGCGNDNAVMIGDRYEKDGIAAEKNGVDYVIVDSSKKERRKLRDMWS